MATLRKPLNPTPPDRRHGRPPLPKCSILECNNRGVKWLKAFGNKHVLICKSCFNAIPKELLP